jgi:ferric-dicitrate binding protein FerR (iron transport regulator)
MASDYTSFQTEDFVLDDSFQAYVAGSDVAAVQFWQGWLAAHPAQRPAAEQARQLVLVLTQARQPTAPPQHKAEDLQRLQRAIRKPAVAPMLRTQGRRRSRLVAGLLLFLLVLGTGYGLWTKRTLLQPQTEYTATAGQPRTVQLPDGSVVVLNGGSRLTTATAWDSDAPREVWLEGEAYFQVSHLAPAANVAFAQATGNAKFVVHAGELNVSVLGTRFNVINRPGVLNKVTLNAGKVLVEHPRLLGHDEQLMKPGDLVEYAPANHNLVTRVVKPAYYSAWVKGSVQFDHTPLTEIIQLLRDTYGLRVTVDDPAMLRQTITGSLPNANADVLLSALAKSLGVRSERSGQQVRFRALR